MRTTIKKSKTSPIVKSVDLFCGAGGLTRGLEKAGLNVTLGVDLDPDCKFPYERNNRARFLLKSVSDISGKELVNAFDGADYKLLAGCAPCQTFSTYQQGRYDASDDRWNLLNQFGRLICEVDPDFVTMENVPRLADQDVFLNFVSLLEKNGYFVTSTVVNCANYSVPQLRNRLVILASKFAKFHMIPTTTPGEKRKTVRATISGLPEIKAGQKHPKDPLHRAAGLSDLNLARIQASKPGGTWKDWDENLVADCHKKPTGETYRNIYGRMVWDEPAPTMTTQYNGFGNGRFGHPEQDRAISLREGAMLQSFPKSYKFVPNGAFVSARTISRLIGNAVPVNLGCAIGQSIMEHIKNIELQRQSS